MRERTETIFFWDNPTKGSGTFIKRSWFDRVYERKVDRNSFLNPVEASKVLQVSLVHVFRLIRNRQLKAYPKAYLGEKIFLIRMDDIIKFIATKRSAGRPRGGERSLANG